MEIGNTNSEITTLWCFGIAIWHSNFGSKLTFEKFCTSRGPEWRLADRCLMKVYVKRFLRKAVVLQCVAVCCSVLQCVAVCCSVLQCVAVRCSLLQFVTVCCLLLYESICKKGLEEGRCVADVLQCVADVLYCVAVYCSMLFASVRRHVQEGLSGR